MSNEGNMFLFGDICAESGILIDTFSPVREDFLTGEQ